MQKYTKYKETYILSGIYVVYTEWVVGMLFVPVLEKEVGFQQVKLRDKWSSNERKYVY